METQLWKSWLHYLRGKRASNKALCLFACLIIPSFCVLSIYSVLSHPPPEAVESRQYTECVNNYDSSDLCVVSPVSSSSRHTDTTGTIVDDVEIKPNEFIREKRSLAAQEGVWRASNVLVWLGFLQFFAALVTVIFLFISVLATRQMLNEARLTTRQAITATREAQAARALTERIEQPHIFLSIRASILSEDRDNFCVKGSLKNLGRTPAVRFRYRIFECGISFEGDKCTSSGGHGSPEQHTDDFLSIGRDDNPIELTLRKSFSTSTLLFSTNNLHHTRLFYFVKFTYRTVLSDTEFISYKCYRLMPMKWNHEVGKGGELASTDWASTPTPVRHVIEFRAMLATVADIREAGKFGKLTELEIENYVSGSKESRNQVLLDH